MRVPYGWLRELAPVVCSAAELAERLTMAGFEVEELLEVDGEPVMEIKVTSNRGDALSMLGLAREVAALCRGHIIPPPTCVTEGGPDVNTLAKVVVEAPDLCPRYAARVIRGVTIGPSPEWVQVRLTQAGIRPINNVVDVTNYVMLELGQPLHAFDLATLAERTIIVRRARSGEPFTTLDGVARTLTADMLVIADAERAVALAGIMGGENTEVTERTADILLESAHFDRTVIRRTARAHGMSTESSYRFERIVDPAGCVRAADRAAQLMREWAGGTVAAGVIDAAEPLPPVRVIPLRPARVNALLGTEIAVEEMAVIMRGLALDAREENGVFSVTVPSFRPDLVEETDLIEEVARIHGYEHIPVTVPGRITASGRLAPELEFENRARELLASAGLFEGVSYSLIDARRLEQMRLPEDAPERAQLVAIRNPKSDEYTHLRPTLFVSLLESLSNNARRNLDDVQIFELGRIFRSSGGGLRFNYARRARRVDEDVRVQDAARVPREQRSVGIALMGRPWTARWGGGQDEVDFFTLKGIVEQFLTDMNVLDVSFAPTTHPTLHPGRTANVRAGGRVIGLLGEAHPRVAETFDLPRRALLAEIDLDAMMDVAVVGRPQPGSRFPAVDRDVALLVAVEHPAAGVQAAIAAAAGELAESIELFDLYQGTNIPAGSRSLAYRLTFRAPDRTLADEEVDAAMANVRAALIGQLGAIIR